MNNFACLGKREIVVAKAYPKRESTIKVSIMQSTYLENNIIILCNLYIVKTQFNVKNVKYK